MSALELSPVDYLEIALVGIGLIVWLVRLEGKISQVQRLVDEAQKDIDVLRTKHEGLDTKIVEQLGEVKQSLARLEGRLGIIKEGD
jgi:uncharacterized protein YoxC